MAYRIKNWGRFQHYKNKKPGARLPWIKLYSDLLEDPDFHELSGDSTKFLMMLWLISTDTDGQVPDLKKVAFRVRKPLDKVKHLISTLSHWIEDDTSDTLERQYSDPIQEEEKIRVREDKEPPLPPKGEEKGFEVFWKAYPKKVGKGAAERSWEHIKPDTEKVRQILISVDAQKKSPQWQKEGGQFIPNPATWLNQRRWLDEPIKNENRVRTELDRIIENDVRGKYEKHDVGEMPSMFGRMVKT